MSEIKEPQFYVPLKTARVRTVKVGGDTTVRLPFKREGRGRTIVSIGEVSVPGDDVDRGHPRVRLSKHHGRSITNEGVNLRVIWSDKFGTPFGAEDWKGAAMGDVTIQSEETSPYGVRAFGLKDDVGIERMTKASLVMRKNGLPTEAPVRIKRLHEIYDGGELMPVEEWKARQLRKLEQDLESARTRGQRPEEINLKREIREVREYLGNTDFFIVERDLQVAERLRDIGELQTEEDFARMIAPLFRWVNRAIGVKKPGFFTSARKTPFDYSETEDVREYFVSWLPERIGIYLARLRALKLVHRYPHGQNWSAVGTLYDLDSVRGLPLGDKAPTESDYQRDYEWTINAIGEIWGQVEIVGSFSFSSGESYLARLVGPLMNKQGGMVRGVTMARRNFGRAYRRESVKLGLSPLSIETRWVVE